MIAVLLHLALASSGTSQVPAEAPIPPAIATTDVSVCVQITATHFVAQSYVDEVQWIVFVNEDCGLRHIRPLGPHQRELLPIVAGAADGVSIEIITRSSTGELLTSGSLACSTITGSAVYFSREGGEFTGWIPHHGGRSLTRAKVGRSSLPEGIFRCAGATVVPDGMSARDSVAAAHVPVPLPTENRKRDKSRRLKRRKLPPV